MDRAVKIAAMLLGIEKVAQNIFPDANAPLDERHLRDALAAQLELARSLSPLSELLQMPNRKPAAEKQTKVLSVSE